MIKKLLQHKFITTVLILAVIGGGYYGYTKFYGDKGVVRYVTAQVKKGMLIVSISGSGQVSVSNQVDVKSKTSGEITGLFVEQGQEVGAGALIAQLDARDAARAVRDAETSLETAKLELDKLLEPIEPLTLLQSENSLIQAKESKQKAEDDLKKAYEDGFNSVTNAFLDLPSVISGLSDIIFSKSFDSSQDNLTWYLNAIDNKTDEADKAAQYKYHVIASYNEAREAYEKNFDSYKSTSRTDSEGKIEALISETYNTTRLISEAVKNLDNYIDFVQDSMTLRHVTIPTVMTTHQTTVSSYTSKTNSILTSLLSIKRSIADSRDTIVSANRTIEERQLSLDKLKEGVDSLDVRAKKIIIQQKEDALTTARQTLADTSVRAPFAGVIAKVSAKKGDTASSGTIIATLTTKQKIAEISLNEIDVAKVKVDQKATLTFDAVPDFTITGQVAEIESIGTVSQGVVTYIVTIGFDTQDERIKPGMSVSASVIIEAQPDVLLVSNSAIKTQGTSSYVEIVEGGDRTTVLAGTATGVELVNTPKRQTIEIGLANDEFTEVKSGLIEGDVVVTRTIQPNAVVAQTATQQQSGGLRIPGMGGGR